MSTIKVEGFQPSLDPSKLLPAVLESEVTVKKHGAVLDSRHFGGSKFVLSKPFLRPERLSDGPAESHPESSRSPSMLGLPRKVKEEAKDD